MVAGEEQGAEQTGFEQDIKSGLSKPLRNKVWYLFPILWQQDHTDFLKPPLPAT